MCTNMINITTGAKEVCEEKPLIFDFVIVKCSFKYKVKSHDFIHSAYALCVCAHNVNNNMTLY